MNLTKHSLKEKKKRKENGLSITPFIIHKDAGDVETGTQAFNSMMNTGDGQAGMCESAMKDIFMDIQELGEKKYISKLERQIHNLKMKLHGVISETQKKEIEEEIDLLKAKIELAEKSLQSKTKRQASKERTMKVEKISEAFDNVSPVEKESRETVTPGYAQAVRSIRKNDKNRKELLRVRKAPKAGVEAMSDDIKLTLDESLFTEQKTTYKLIHKKINESLASELGKDYKEIVLQDDETETGGLSHSGETLGEFIAEVGDNFKSLDELNSTLKACGIKTIKKGIKEMKESKLNETWAGEDVIDDLVDRAQSLIDERNYGDVDECIRQAIDDGLIYSKDVWDLAEHYGVVEDSELIERYYEDLYNDIYARVEEPEEDEEDIEESLNTHKHLNESITVEIDEDEALDMLMDRLGTWNENNRPGDIAYDLYEQMYQSYIDGGVFDGGKFDVMEIVDNDWVNYCEIVEPGDEEHHYDELLKIYEEQGLGDVSTEDVGFSSIEAAVEEDGKTYFLCRW